MSYNELAKLEVLSAINGINSESDLVDFKNMLARYFAEKAQKAIDALWDNGDINEQAIEKWGSEHMRTPYHHASNRS